MTTLDIVIEDPRWEKVQLPNWADRATALALKAAKAPEGYEIVIMACDDPRIAALNAEFRDKPKPTNVLSWPAHDLAPLMPGEIPAPPPAPDGFDDALGDIAISYDTCVREAREQGKALADHATHLLLHATLHLLGYDHETEEDAQLMEKLESEALASIGIADPY
ncbi:rRNA maturation RNase YbeY [Pontivivens insulae]|uniref:Endoribonuclease YbeY n=1 Tax=Pontivivens insulae TaxID=1639689 RepID=A0A2R8AER9_9RHOB|nr:rRNA maturation RNase YbeY [Pontivivens insulae]RED11783.1 putative rRNA maturation factor [Pontivivens insulae]SPF30540.1 Endoribonuclease YbeY [Pontivivens insulae]